MKERIVLWGTNANDEKILLALNLRSEDNEYDLMIWPEKDADETFYKKLLFEWRDGKDVEFTSEYEKRTVPLRLAESLLPDDIKTDKSDIIQRTQTEWHFIVLSSKLNQVYASELDDLKDRIEKLEKYEKPVWEELKGFWDKVQEQVKEKNLFHEHVRSLKETTNSLFDHMKNLRAKMDEEFNESARKNYEQFTSAIDEIEQRINSNTKLKEGFEDLKKIQKKFHSAQFSKDLRNKVWNRLDAAFKAIKEARFGPAADKGNSALQRLERRLAGLLNAIDKMNQSLGRDKSDLKYQSDRINESDGQLEAQLRQAKIMMIEERIRSKSEKVDEMLKTKAEIEQRIEREKVKEAKLEEKQKREEIKKEIEKEIKHQIAEQHDQILEQEGENIIKAAAALGVQVKDENPDAVDKEDSIEQDIAVPGDIEKEELPSNDTEDTEKTSPKAEEQAETESESEVEPGADIENKKD